MKRDLVFVNRLTFFPRARRQIGSLGSRYLKNLECFNFIPYLSHMNAESDSSTAIKRYLKEVDLLVSSIDADSTILLSEVATSPGGLSRDGGCHLELAENKMTATAEFFPAMGRGRPLTRDEVLQQIRERGIVHGVVVPAGHPPTSGKLVVAIGTPPVNSVAETLEVLADLMTSRLALDDKALSFDFKTQSPFVQVHRGDLLTRRIPSQRGVDGLDLEGNAVPFCEIPTVSLKPGKNVAADASGYAADCDGNFRCALGSFWVDKVLILDFGVGYDTGHIVFDGDVRLRGEIAAGFTIRTQGALHSTRIIDVTEIVSGGEVVTPEGIIGRPGATLETGGPIRAKFMETTKVRTEALVEIQSSVLNCQIQTLDRLVMGSKGVLLGGRVEAQNGVDVFQIGNPQGIKSEVVCGTDYTVVDKREWARVQSLSLVRQLRTLETHRQTHQAQDVALTRACGKVRDQVLKLNELSRRLVSMIDRNEAAEVKVRGTVHGGTIIEICRAVFRVVRPLTSVRFFLDKTQGVIREGRL